MRQLSAEEIDEVLVRNGAGVLALVNGNRPNAIPMSFGYDGTEPIFPMQWGAGYNGRKERCIESNPNACFTVYEQHPDQPLVSRSVVIEGTIREIGKEQEAQAYASLAENAEFGTTLDVWTPPFEQVELKLFGLAIEVQNGREFSPE